MFGRLLALLALTALLTAQSARGTDCADFPERIVLDAALDLIGTGEANVLPLALLLTWTAANRSRLAGLA